ncbi:MAG: deoxyribose-phosphate aldolase [Vallitalea sp.]|jgi:deoxyribose-phosphate aldolase|nr:deoxyribose-phosphate aldolase [Vallitalea sp.]
MNVQSIIDYTLLKPESKTSDIKKLCEDAMKYKFASVCVNPTHVKMVADILKDTDINVCTVVGFPLGANTTKVKVFETEDAIQNGAVEIDMVLNIGAMKEKNYGLVECDIKAVVDKCKEYKVLSKVILENCLLEKEEIVKACEICKKAGADFVKTSTSFNSGGATVEDIRLMRETVGAEMGVKASGGVRDHKTALEIIGAGASRIGASRKLLPEE